MAEDYYQSLRASFRRIVVALVITAVVMVITAEAMETSPMTMKLHVPLETGSTFLTVKAAGGKMASFHMSY